MPTVKEKKGCIRGGREGERFSSAAKKNSAESVPPVAEVCIIKTNRQIMRLPLINDDRAVELVEIQICVQRNRISNNFSWKRSHHTRSGLQRHNIVVSAERR